MDVGNKNQLEMSKPKVKVEIREYCYKCGDGCCTEYGTITKVNDVELDCHNQDASTIVKQILEHLGYEVEMIESYGDE